MAVDHATLSPLIPKKDSGIGLLDNQNTSIGDLNKNFGSKRAKRHTEQIERMKTNANVVKEQLEETVQSKFDYLPCNAIMCCNAFDL